MKVGDSVYSTTIRPFEIAKVISSDVKTIEKFVSGRKKKSIRTTYLARFMDGSTMTFYGFDVDRTVFKKTGIDGQMSLDDIFGGNG